MISPIGTFAILLDQILSASVDSIVQSMIALITPLAAPLFALYYLAEGFKWWSGDHTVGVNFVPKLVRNLFIVAFATNLDLYDTYVRDLLTNIVPAQLSNAAVTVMPGQPDPRAIVSVASAYDTIYGIIVRVTGQAYLNVGVVTGTGLIIVGALSSLCAMLGLSAAIFVFVVAKFMLNMVVAIGPVLIMTALFDVTRPMFDRSIGKIASLVLLQVFTFVIIGFSLQMNRYYIRQFVEVGNNMSADGSVPGLLTTMLAMAVWFIMAGAMVLYLPARLAYSIGSGVMSGGMSLAALFLAKSMMGGGKGGGSGNIRLDMPPRPPSGGGGPPQLSGSSSPQLQLPRPTDRPAVYGQPSPYSSFRNSDRR